MLPNPKPQILPSHPLLPSKTISRATAKTESDRMSFMAGLEGALEGEVGLGNQWCPSPSPNVPPHLSLCSWCVEGPSGAPSTNLIQLLDCKGSRSQPGLAFMVREGGGAGSSPSPWASPGACLPVPNTSSSDIPSCWGWAPGGTQASPLAQSLPLFITLPSKSP